MHTIITRSAALELCPLLMVTSRTSQKFAQECLLKVLEDGRFNPFEYEEGAMQMSRTFQRGDHGQLRSVDRQNPLFSRSFSSFPLNPMPSSSSVAMAVSVLVPTSTAAEHKPSALRGMAPELKNVRMRKSTLPTISEKARHSKHTLH